MDEAEKYQQRLEAIAEKRRLQEEQDKARREMEDERLRLQQLKRKSLRDQWLMEGAPLSPTSPDSQSPRSPLWGSKAQEMEKRIDKLESESQRLAEEEEKLKEQMEDGQTEAVRAAEAGADVIQDVVLQNGRNNPAGFADDEEKTDLLKKTAADLINGQTELEAITNHSLSEDRNPPTSNGPAPASEDEESQRLEPELNQGDAPNVSIEEGEEEEGTLVMRAERVIITDEGDDVPEDLTAQDQQETTDLEETPVKLETQAGEEVAAAVEEVGRVVVTEADPETFTQPEAQLQTEEEVTREDASINEIELKTDEQDEASEDPTSEQPQCQVDALEGATVALVPVYSEASTITFKLETEGEAEEAAEAVLEAGDPAPGPGQFQEVPLIDPQESSRTETEAAEQDPLLSLAKDPDTQAEISAAANSLSSIETPAPSRGRQGEETQAPKRKTCQCCSVM